MRALILAAGMAAVLVMPPCPAGAQTQPPGQQDVTHGELRDRCNRLSVIQSVTGSEKAQLMRDCMAGKVAAPPPPEETWQQTYQSCADEGKFSRRIRGQELINFIEKCVNEPGSGTSAASSGPSWGERRAACRKDGRQKMHLSGNDLSRYIDKCMSQSQ